MKNFATGRYDFFREKGTGTSLASFWKATGAHFPNATAVKSNGLALSYEELDRLADFAANRLFGYGVKGGEPIGLFAPLCSQMVIGALAILKVGGVLVFEDPERCTFKHLLKVMRRAPCRLVLTLEEDLHLIPLSNGHTSHSIEEIALAEQAIPKPRFPANAKAEDPPLVIFEESAGILKRIEFTERQIIAALSSGRGVVGGVKWRLGGDQAGAPCFLLEKERILEPGAPIRSSGAAVELRLRSVAP